MRSQNRRSSTTEGDTKLRIKRIKSAISVFIALIFLQVTCRADDIKVGAMIHLTGDFSAWGTAYLEGITMAKENINTSGGIRGRNINIIIEDTRFDSKLVASAAQKLLSIDKVPVAIVSTFTEVMVAGPMFQQAKVPLLVFGDSGGEIEGLGDYIFSSGTWVKGFALSASAFLASDLQKKRVAVISTNNPWSQSNAKTFEEDFASRGGKIAYRADINPTDSDFRTVLNKIKRENIEGVFAPITASIVPFFTQAHNLKINIPIVAAAAALDSDIVDAAGAAVEGRFVTNSYLDPKRPQARDLLQAYHERYGKDPVYPSVVARGWDGMMAVANALRHTNDISPAAIKEALKSVDFEAAGFRLKFDNHGTAALPAAVLQVQRGVLKKWEKAGASGTIPTLIK